MNDDCTVSVPGIITYLQKGLKHFSTELVREDKVPDFTLHLRQCFEVDLSAQNSRYDLPLS